jgi:RNA polymerase sigma-70 factor, ECF subfamily
MSTASRKEMTRLLDRVSKGDEAAANVLMPLVYDELRALAQSYLMRERVGHTLEATALVNEAYLRLVDQKDADWQDRTHFFCMAAEMIRRILVDHARARAAMKRGGGRQRLTLSEGMELAQHADDEGIDILALEEAMNELAKHNKRQARVVELRFFGGLNVEETAAVLNISERTVKADWRFARAWLRRVISPDASRSENDA